MLYDAMMCVFFGLAAGGLNEVGRAAVATQSCCSLPSSGAVFLTVDLLAGQTDRVSALIRFTGESYERGRGGAMTTEEQIQKMKKAIAQAIKVMGDRFGSTEQDVARAVQELKASMQGASEPSLSVKTVPGPGSQSPQAAQTTIETQ